ncbi:MAG: hypothetical protein AAF497_17930, partial [Planctomycetota bacterium]
AASALLTTGTLRLLRFLAIGSCEFPAAIAATGKMELLHPCMLFTSGTWLDLPMVGANICNAGSKTVE